MNDKREEQIRKLVAQWPSRRGLASAILLAFERARLPRKPWALERAQLDALAGFNASLEADLTAARARIAELEALLLSCIDAYDNLDLTAKDTQGINSRDHMREVLNKARQALTPAPTEKP